MSHINIMSYTVRVQHVHLGCTTYTFSIHYVCALKHGRVVRLQPRATGGRLSKNDIREINYDHDSITKIITHANEW